MIKLYVELNKSTNNDSNFPHCISVGEPSDFDIVMNFLNTVNVHPCTDKVEYHTNVEGSYISHDEWELLEENAELLDVEFIIEESADESESL
jgi:hypothetical protein